MNASLLIPVAMIVAAVGGGVAIAQPQQPIRGVLDAPSTETFHRCLEPCLCPIGPVTSQLRGVFTLVPTTPEPWFDVYEVRDAVFLAQINGQDMRFTGSGIYRIGGDFAYQHEMILDLSANGEPAQQFYGNEIIIHPPYFPRIDITIETPIVECRQTVLYLLTSPHCAADFDGDGDRGTDLDIEAFFGCLGGACCETCLTADIDGDGDTGTDLDIEAFFRALGGGGGC